MKTVTVIVTTAHKGVFVGKLDVIDDSVLLKEHVVLTDVRMVLRWGTTHGWMELARSGPTPSTQPSACVDKMGIRSVTAIVVCTKEAAEAWDAI